VCVRCALWASPLVAALADAPAASQPPAAPPTALPPRPPSLFAPPVAPGGPAPLGVAADWTEHRSPDGRAYWHNGRSGASSWEKPRELLSAVERAETSTPWREHASPDGKPYYYHTVSKESSWTLPEALRVAREAAARAEAVRLGAPMPAQQQQQPPAQQPPAQPQQPQRPPPAAPAPAPAPQVHVRSAAEALLGAAPVAAPAPVHYASEAEAREAFLALLQEAGVGADGSWDKAMRTLVHDPRYGALTSLAKRKAAFNDFVTQRARQEREERRGRERAARAALRAAVEEALTAGLLPAEGAAAVRLRDAERLLAGDPRVALAAAAGLDAREREAAVAEAVAEHQQRLRDAAQAARDACLASFRQALEALAPAVGPETPWRRAQEALGEPAGALWLGGLSRSERLDAFADWARQRQREQQEAAAVARDAQRRQEREARKAFTQLLAAAAAQGRLTARSSWRDFAAACGGEPAYLAVCANAQGSRPRELFQDAVDELGDALSADAQAVAAALGERLQAAPDAPLQEVTSLLSAAGGRAAGVSTQSLELILGDVRAQKEGHAAKQAKRARRAAEDFAAMLRSRALPVGAAWESVRAEVAGEAAYVALEDEAQRRGLYEVHALLLAASGAEPGEVVALQPAEGKGRKEKKRRKRSRSRERKKERDSKSKRRRSRSSSSSSSRSRRKGRGRDRRSHS